MTDKSGTGTDGSYFVNGKECSYFSGNTCTAMFWALDMDKIYSASDGNGVISTGGAVRGNGCGGYALVVRSLDATIVTILATVVLHAPASVVSVCLLLSW